MFYLSLVGILLSVLLGLTAGVWWWLFIPFILIVAAAEFNRR